MSVLTVGVGTWVISGTRTLEAACTLSAQSGGGNTCGIDLPFYLLGIMLIATGAVSTIVALLTMVRARRASIARARTPISTLQLHEVDSLRDVA
jgi:hypothetical protein